MRHWLFLGFAFVCFAFIIGPASAGGIACTNRLDLLMTLTQGSSFDENGAVHEHCTVMTTAEGNDLSPVGIEYALIQAGLEDSADDTIEGAVFKAFQFDATILTVRDADGREFFLAFHLLGDEEVDDLASAETGWFDIGSPCDYFNCTAGKQVIMDATHGRLRPQVASNK